MKKLDVQMLIQTCLIAVAGFFLVRLISEHDKTRELVQELKVDVAVIKNQLLKLTSSASVEVPRPYREAHISKENHAKPSRI